VSPIHRSFLFKSRREVDNRVGKRSCVDSGRGKKPHHEISFKVSVGQDKQNSAMGKRQRDAGSVTQVQPKLKNWKDKKKIELKINKTIDMV
jgi:hypothetical protein